MIISVPFLFDVFVIPPRSRTPRWVRYGDWLEVDIAEIDADQAPLVARWTDPRPENLTAMEVRVEGEHLLTPLAIPDAQKGRRVLTAEYLKESVEGGEYGLVFSPVLEQGWDKFAQGTPGAAARYPGHSYFREVIYDQRNRRTAPIHDLVAQLCIINGQVWKHAEEPIISVHRKTGELKVLRKPFMRPVKNEVFRLDRYEDALLAVERNNPDALSDARQYEVEVYQPELLKFNDEVTQLLSITNSVLLEGQKDLADQEKERVIGWLHLRDARRTAVADETDSALDDLAARAWEYSNLGFLAETERERLQSALRRWDERPIDIDVNSFTL